MRAWLTTGSAPCSLNHQSSHSSPVVQMLLAALSGHHRMWRFLPHHLGSKQTSSTRVFPLSDHIFLWAKCPVTGVDTHWQQATVGLDTALTSTIVSIVWTKCFWVSNICSHCFFAKGLLRHPTLPALWYLKNQYQDFRTPRWGTIVWGLWIVGEFELWQEGLLLFLAKLDGCGTAMHVVISCELVHWRSKWTAQGLISFLDWRWLRTDCPSHATVMEPALSFL